MDITTVTVPAIKAGRWGGVYAPMERAMAAHGVDMIGDPDYRQKNAARFTDAHGEMRPERRICVWFQRSKRCARRCNFIADSVCGDYGKAGPDREHGALDPSYHGSKYQASGVKYQGK